MDVFSRKIVGWEVYETESAEYAASVFRKAHLREGVTTASLVLHSDNGSPRLKPFSSPALTTTGNQSSLANMGF